MLNEGKTTMKPSEIVSYVKASWLAGNNILDCQAELRRKSTDLNDQFIIDTIGTVYFVLNDRLKQVEWKITNDQPKNII
jgi:hypothetical protein